MVTSTRRIHANALAQQRHWYYAVEEFRAF